MLVGGGFAAAMVVGSFATLVSLGGRSDAESGRPAGYSGNVEVLVQGDLLEEREFDGTVTWGDEWELTISAQPAVDGEPAGAGIVTAARERGAQVGFGDWLVEIDGRRLYLVSGEVPLYRDLHVTDGALLEGADVAQLQEFLLEEGFDAGGHLVPDGTLGWATEQAVREWQRDSDLPDTGRIDRTQLVFAPSPMRIAAGLRVGATFDALVVSEAEPSVVVDTTARDRSSLVMGEEVIVRLPDGSTVEGMVAAQEQVTVDDAQAIWRTVIDVGDRLPDDTDVVVVETARPAAGDSLLVPVGALTADVGGGFVIDVVTGPGRTERREVEVLAVVGAMAAIEGDLAVGDEVVVP